jgi:hypothetical protein
MNTIQDVIYYNSNYLPVRRNGVSAWQGSRLIDQDIFLLCGTTNPSPQTGEGIVYSGNLSFTEGKTYYVNVPYSTYTSVYGPNYDKETGICNFVGSYTNIYGNTKGFIYTGKLDEYSFYLHKNYTYPSVNQTYNIVFVHSISNGYTVGNAGNSNNSDTLSFLYNINNLDSPIQIQYPEAKTTTSYGIWYNKLANTYTIVGGYSPEDVSINDIYADGIPKPIGIPFVVDYNPSSGEFENWTRLNLPLDVKVLSHIQGISGLSVNYVSGLSDISISREDAYSICINSLNSTGYAGFYAEIRRVPNQNFQITKFIEINYGTKGINSINSVANNNVVGLFISPNGNESFQAHVN